MRKGQRRSEVGIAESIKGLRSRLNKTKKVIGGRVLFNHCEFRNQVQLQKLRAGQLTSLPLECRWHFQLQKLRVGKLAEIHTQFTID
jgi:hypothetical protein